MPTIFPHAAPEVEDAFLLGPISCRDTFALAVLRLRPATPADAEVLAATVAEGFTTYLDFAPPGWRAPQPLELALGHRGAPAAADGARVAGRPRATSRPAT
jgi:hypothetical protein